jgi:hypothetical protein
MIFVLLFCRFYDLCILVNVSIDFLRVLKKLLPYFDYFVNFFTIS